MVNNSVMYLMQLNFILKMGKMPWLRGSRGRSVLLGPRGCRFHSRLGHMPRLQVQVQSLVGVYMEGN